MRLISSILIQDDHVITTRNYSHPTIVGKPNTVCTYLERYKSDEIQLTNVLGDALHLIPLVNELAKSISTPLSICGGIDSIYTDSKLIESGADRLCIEKLLFEEPHLVDKIIDIYGAQSVVLRITFSSTQAYFRCNGLPLKQYGPILKKRLAEFANKGLTDIMIYDSAADGLACEPSYHQITPLLPTQATPIFGGGISPTSVSVVYDQYHNTFPDISFAFSHYLHLHENPLASTRKHFAAISCIRP